MLKFKSCLMLLTLSTCLSFPASGEVAMGASACVNGYDALTLDYRNQTPFPMDMHGFRMTFPTGSLRGSFATNGGGTHMVLPGGKPTINYSACGGNTGVARHFQLESKIGSCNEPPEPNRPAALQCSEVDEAAAHATYYNANQCLPDGMGVGLADGWGGVFDSFADRTQIQVALPADAFTWRGQSARFDPAASIGGPFYMMAMAALQEYLYLDMQVLMSLGAAASGAGLVDSSGASLYRSPADTGKDTASYGSFGIGYLVAAGRLMADYPKYFSTQDLNKLVSTGGAGPTAANSPQQVNSGFLAALNLWWYYDLVSAGQNLCFGQFLKNAADKSAGVKLLLSGYFIGPNVAAAAGENDDFATHVLPATGPALAAADATPFMKAYPFGSPADRHEYLTRIFVLADLLKAAASQSTACGGARPIYDAGITLPQVKALYFGEGGTPAAQGPGGLLWHFAISSGERQSLWSDLECAFAKLKGRAPGRGLDEISYRYQFLTLLRVARAHLTGYLEKPADSPSPADAYASEYSIWVTTHSNNPCAAAIPDKTWPTLTLADSAYSRGEKLAGTFTDDRGIRFREYTTDIDWLSWFPTDSSFAVPANLGEAQRLWFRVVDSCGNAVIEEVPVASSPVRATVPALGRRGPRAEADRFDAAGRRRREHGPRTPAFARPSGRYLP